VKSICSSDYVTELENEGDNLQTRSERVSLTEKFSESTTS
jgi:hypothetical protein